MPVLAVQAGEAHVDIPARKLCLATLSKMLASWSHRSDFRAFAIDSIGVRCCLRGISNGSVDVCDGGALSLLSEAATTLCALHKAYGADMAAAAQAMVEREEQSGPTAEWAELLAAAAATTVKRTKDAYKALLRRKQARAPRFKRGAA